MNAVENIAKPAPCMHGVKKLLLWVAAVLVLTPVALVAVYWPDQNAELRYAAEENDVGELQALLDAGADIHAKDPDDGGTALHWAVRENATHAAEFLLDNGANVNALGSGENAGTPLHWAAYHDVSESAELLIERGADIDAHIASDSMKVSPLLLAVNRESSTMIRVLLGHGADTKIRRDSPESFNTVLHAAARHNLTDSVEALLASGVPADIKNSRGGTALHVAMWQEENADAVVLLLEYGADINARDEHGFTPLHHSVQANTPGIAELLIQRGAQVDAIDDDGITALQLANEGGRTKIAELLTRAMQSAENE